MNEEEDIKKIKSDWAKEFGREIIDDSSAKLPSNWEDLKLKLHSIPSEDFEFSSRPAELKNQFPSWIWPIMAAAAILLAVWIFIPGQEQAVNEIDWAVLDEVEASELHLALEESYIYDFASVNHEELEEINAYNINDETIEDWLENENDILLWVE